jgi:hypothetical protein
MGSDVMKQAPVFVLNKSAVKRIESRNPAFDSVRLVVDAWGRNESGTVSFDSRAARQSASSAPGLVIDLHTVIAIGRLLSMARATSTV